MRKTLPYAIALAGLLACSVGVAEPEGTVPVPVNADASPETRALLQILYSISGKDTLTGQHNYPNTKDTFTRRTAEVCGKAPAVSGQDFGFAAPGNQDAAAARPDIIAEIKRQHQKGSIITLCWHAVRADFDISGSSPAVQAILEGLKTYGMFVADNGIDWAISVTPDERIPVLHEELRRGKGADFEVGAAPE